MKSHPEPLAHSPDDAARRLGVGRTKVFELMNSGELRRIKLGRRTLVPDADLVALIERRAERDEGSPR